MVAPFTGAWIETKDWLPLKTLAPVAPFTGAWIETGITNVWPTSTFGRPLHGGVD